MKKNSISKKILSVFAAALMLLSAVPTVMAADVAVRELEASVLGGTVTVTGVLENGTKEMHMLALVSNVSANVDNLSTAEDYNNNVIAIGYGVTADSSADTPGEFTIKIEMPDKIRTGTYKVTVGNNAVPNTESVTFSYLGYSDRTALLNSVNSKDAAAADIVTVIDKIPSALDAAGANSSIYKKMDSEAKLKYAELLIKYRDERYPDGMEIADFGEASKEALLVASVVTASDSSGYTNAFETVKLYNDMAGLNLKDSRYVKLSDEETFVKTLQAQKEIVYASDIAESMDDALYLARFNETSYLSMPTYISQNNEFFGIDEDEIKEMTSKTKLNEYLCTALRTNTPVYTLEEFKEAWTDSCKQAKSDYEEYTKKNSGSSSSGSSSGSDKNKKVVATIDSALVRDDPLDKKVLVTEYYDDVTGYDWAYAAILDLTKDNIISGTGNKKFEPARTLKREEFMKLLVNVFNLADVKAESSFTDVTDKNAWYYMYIASAEKAGITNGRGDGEFGIGDDVTREEMATLVYRAAVMSGINLNKTNTSAYSDADSIASYAAEAVQILSDNGILSGDNGAFNPKSGASRAQAAVVIYNIKGHIK